MGIGGGGEAKENLVPASFTLSASKCTYPMVVVIDAWQQISLTVFSWTPLASINVAAVCRMSWNRIRHTPASRTSTSKKLRTNVSWQMWSLKPVTRR